MQGGNFAELICDRITFGNICVEAVSVLLKCFEADLGKRVDKEILMKIFCTLNFKVIFLIVHNENDFQQTQ